MEKTHADQEQSLKSKTLIVHVKNFKKISKQRHPGLLSSLSITVQFITNSVKHLYIDGWIPNYVQGFL